MPGPQNHRAAQPLLLRSIHDYVGDTPYERAGERPVAVQQPVLGRGEEQVEHHLSVGIRRDLAPLNGSFDYRAVLCPQWVPARSRQATAS
jgi:hypothetical protein